MGPGQNLSPGQSQQLSFSKPFPGKREALRIECARVHFLSAGGRTRPRGGGAIGALFPRRRIGASGGGLSGSERGSQKAPRRRLSGAAMASLLKKTTGLVGLAVCESPHERLRILYTKIIDVLEQMPTNAAYRKYTEQITNEKLGMVKAEPDVKKLEERLQGGQIEEVILQAENELSLARKMMQWKPWEPLVEEPPANQWKWPI